MNVLDRSYVKEDCRFCSYQDCNLGDRNLENFTAKGLQEILYEESAGRKQKIGNKLKTHNDRILCNFFNLGKGFERSFTGSYCTSKTEVMKGMMRKLMEFKQKVHFLLMNLFLNLNRT